MRTFDILPNATIGEWDVTTPDHYYVPLETDAKWVGPIIPPFHKDRAFGPVKLTVPLPGGAAGADRATGVILPTRAAFMLWSDGVFSPIREVGVLETTQIDPQTVQVKIKPEE